MTTHTPLRCAYSGMVAYSHGGDGYIVLLNSGNYPSFSSFLNQTWIWNGTNGNEDWTDISPTTSFIDPNGPLGPSVNGVVMSARNNQVMGFDGTNVMLFGGKGSSSTAGTFEDTWTFSPTSSTWTLQSALTTIPQSRYGAAGASMDGYGVLMFSGQNAGVLLEETWLWSGTAWSQISVANGTGPAARTGAAMAGNLSTGASSNVLLFGGQGTNSQFNDTWLYNGASGWGLVSPATSPSVRSGHCLAYDSHNSVWVMFGGYNEYNYLPETWTFNGTTWTQRSVGAGPAGRVGAQMAFDTTNNLTIMYGGVSATTNYPSNETWAFNGSTFVWTQL